MSHPLIRTLKRLNQSPLETEFWLDLMKRAVTSVSNGIVITDATQPDHPIIYINPAFERITRYTFDEVVNRNCRFLQGEVQEQPTLPELRLAIQEGRECHVILQNFRKDGTLFWNELYIAPIYNLEGCLTHFIGVQNDITEHKEAQEALRRQECDLRTIVDNMADGLAIVDRQGEVIFVNQAAEKLFHRTTEQILGQSLGIPIITDGRAEIDIHRPGKPMKWVEMACNSVLWQGSPAHLISLRDITKRKQTEEKITQMALYDELTSLPNRVLFNERLQHILDLSQRCSNIRFALLFIDIDRFKFINDSLGHSSGDRLLSCFARRLEQQLRNTDTLARLSGDEFAILLEELSCLEDVVQVAERINLALAYPFELEGREVFTSASIGIAVGRAGLRNPENLVREADTAMYRAKAKGGACYAIFDQQMHHQALARLKLETDLRYAIDRQELQVYYQPLIELNSARLCGFEALLRWHHPQEGSISPVRFIPIAEETGLILSLGKYVLRQACQQVQHWLRRGILSPPFKIAVNLSSKQLSEPNLTRQILQILTETGLAPHYLQLEITESVLMENPTAAALIFQELEANSIQLAMDDFGTGYSSLSYLRRFPVQTLKIDRSFTNRLGTQEEDLEIIQSIVSLAHSLKMNVVAEGIETEVQLNHLKAIGCDIGQGFLFSQALDFQEASCFLLRQRKMS